MNKSQLTAMVLFLILTLAFISCKSPAGPASVTDVSASKAPTALREAPGTDWEKLISAAQKEGRLLSYSTIGQGPSRALAEDFKRKYGISTEFLEGRGAELTAKLFTERKVGLFMADLWLGGATTTITDLRPVGVLAPLDPTFILPELTEPEVIKKTWWEGKLPWVDPERTIFAHAAYTSGQITINTQMVKRGEVKGWKDLLDPKWNGKIIINDPTVAGSGALWFAVMAHKIMGLDYMRELVKQKPIILRDQRLQVEWVALSKYPIVVSAKEDVIWEFINAGSPLEVILPQEGMYITAGSGNVSLLTKAPHPNAAKLLVNYLLSKEGQTIYSRAYGAQSARNDIPVDHLEPFRVRQSGKGYFDSNKLEFKLNMDDYMKAGKETFAPVMR